MIVKPEGGYTSPVIACEDCANAEQGTYWDFKIIDVKDNLTTSDNYAKYWRGGDYYAHRLNTVLALSKVPEPMVKNIGLSQGWNLISVPLNLTIWVLGEEAVVGCPLNVTPTNSLASIYRYNSSTDTFDKSDYFEDWGWAPATGSESFATLEPGRGYWVSAKTDCNLTFTGTEASDINVTLDTDWNLIGWYSTEEALLGQDSAVGDPLNVTPTNSLSSIYRYNATKGKFDKCDYLDDWGWWPATGSEGFTGL